MASPESAELERMLSEQAGIKATLNALQTDLSALQKQTTSQAPTAAAAAASSDQPTAAAQLSGQGSRGSTKRARVPTLETPETRKKSRQGPGPMSPPAASKNRKKRGNKKARARAAAAKAAAAEAAPAPVEAVAVAPPAVEEPAAASAAAAATPAEPVEVVAATPEAVAPTPEAPAYTPPDLAGVDARGVTWEYVGAVSDGVRQGQGQCSWIEDGVVSQKYVGSWDGGRLDGQGTMTFYTNGAESSHFEGQYHNGLKIAGRFVDDDGTAFQGKWLAGHEDVAGAPYLMHGAFEVSDARGRTRTVTYDQGDNVGQSQWCEAGAAAAASATAALPELALHATSTSGEFTPPTSAGASTTAAKYKQHAATATFPRSKSFAEAASSPALQPREAPAAAAVSAVPVINKTSKYRKATGGSTPRSQGSWAFEAAAKETAAAKKPAAKADNDWVVVSPAAGAPMSPALLSKDLKTFGDSNPYRALDDVAAPLSLAEPAEEKPFTPAVPSGPVAPVSFGFWKSKVCTDSAFPTPAAKKAPAAAVQKKPSSQPKKQSSQPKKTEAEAPKPAAAAQSTPAVAKKAAEPAAAAAAAKPKAAKPQQQKQQKPKKAAASASAASSASFCGVFGRVPVRIPESDFAGLEWFVAPLVAFNPALPGPLGGPDPEWQVASRSKRAAGTRRSKRVSSYQSPQMTPSLTTQFSDSNAFSALDLTKAPTPSAAPQEAAAPAPAAPATAAAATDGPVTGPSNGTRPYLFRRASSSAKIAAAADAAWPSSVAAAASAAAAAESKSNDEDSDDEKPLLGEDHLGPYEYYGATKNGVRWGKGTCIWAKTSCYYDGQWHNDKMGGKGSFDDAQGTRYTGKFRDGLKNGVFTVRSTDSDSDVKRRYKNDEELALDRKQGGKGKDAKKAAPAAAFEEPTADNVLQGGASLGIGSVDETGALFMPDSGIIDDEDDDAAAAAAAAGDDQFDELDEGQMDDMDDDMWMDDLDEPAGDDDFSEEDAPAPQAAAKRQVQETQRVKASKKGAGPQLASANGAQVGAAGASSETAAVKPSKKKQGKKKKPAVEESSDEDEEPLAPIKAPPKAKKTKSYHSKRTLPKSVEAVASSASGDSSAATSNGGAPMSAVEKAAEIRRQEAEEAGAKSNASKPKSDSLLESIKAATKPRKEKESKRGGRVLTKERSKRKRSASKNGTLTKPKGGGSKNGTLKGGAVAAPPVIPTPKARKIVKAESLLAAGGVPIDAQGQPTAGKRKGGAKSGRKARNAKAAKAGDDDNDDVANLKADICAQATSNPVALAVAAVAAASLGIVVFFL